MSEKEIVSANIVSLRKEAGLTQFELGEALSYTDKAVSKWERGDSLPDADTLYRLSLLFHVDMNYLFAEHPLAPIGEDEEKRLRKKQFWIKTLYIVTNVAVLLVLLSMLGASIIEIYGLPDTDKKYLFIIPAIPLVLLSVNYVFGRKGRMNTVLLSLAIWSMAYASFVFWGKQLTLLFGIAAVLQIAILLFPYAIKPFSIHQKKK